MRDRRAGFVLVSALAVLAVLAALVGGAAALVRSALAEASLLREELTRDALVHAGLELAAYQSFALSRPPADMAGQRFRLDAGVATLAVTAENGKVDLNGADAELLAGLWRSLGLGPLSAQAFADRVIDWRDKDDKRGRFGGERAEYESAGRPGPANASFAAVDDVQYVLGVSPAAARALRPYLTVANPSGQLSALAAPPATLRALPKMDAGTLDAILAARRKGGPAAGPAVEKLLSDRGATATVTYGPAFRIEVAVETRRAHPPQAFLALRGNARELYRIIRADEAPPPASGR